MAIEDWIPIISISISVFGIIISILIENKFRKDDLVKYEEQLQLIKTPTPVLSIDRAEIHIYEGQRYLQTTIEINNIGKDTLTLKNAVLVIDRPKRKSSGALSFAKMDDPMMAYYLLGIKEDVPPLIMERLYAGDFTVIKDHKNKDWLTEEFLALSEFHSIDVMEEYIEETGHQIAHNEHLKCENVKHIRERGFFQITLIIQPSNMDVSYTTSRIVFVSEEQ